MPFELGGQLANFIYKKPSPYPVLKPGQGLDFSFIEDGKNLFHNFISTSHRGCIL